MRTITRDIASALIFSKDGKLFLGKKDPARGGVYVDCWHVPGGGIDAGESAYDAVIREVREEVGLTLSPQHVEPIDFVTTGESEKTLRETGERVMVHMTFHYFKITLPTDASETTVSLLDDLQTYQWVPVDALQTLKHTPPSRDVLQYLGYDV